MDARNPSTHISPAKSAVAAPALPAHSKTLRDLCLLCFRRSGAPAERRILLLHFSDGGFLPKAATRRNSQSVWTSAFATLRRDVAVASAPLFVRTKITRLSGFAARPKAPLKTAHSKRFAKFDRRRKTRQRLGLRWQAQRDTALERTHTTLPPTSHPPKAPSPLPLCRRTPNASRLPTQWRRTVLPACLHSKKLETGATPILQPHAHAGFRPIFDTDGTDFRRFNPC
jgi:hypothetical protein